MSSFSPFSYFPFQPLPFARASLAALLSVLLAQPGAVFAQGATVARGALPSVVGSREPVTLNFTNAEIEAVARTLATITGRNMVVDPRVKGTMSLMTERPVPPNVAFDQFLAALRLQGFTVVESAGLYKVVPEADAKLQGGSVTVGNGPRTGGNQVVTQIFRLNFENAANLVPVLRPLISPNNTINVNPGNNSLVITDYADNLQRLARIIASMDVSNATDVEVIPMRYANAVDVVPLISRLIEGTGTASSAAGAVPVGGAAAGGQSDNSYRTTLIAEPRSNALIVRSANPARLALVRSLVARLDQPTALGPNGDAGNIYVVYLKNAEATRIAVALRAALASLNTNSGLTGGVTGATQSTPTGTTGTTAQPTTLSNLSGASSSGSNSSTLGSSASGNFANSAMPSTGGNIQADPATNSLIITATEPQYRQLRAVIDKLDGRRAQVLVESLIVEVNANKVADFGIQWQSVLGNSGSTIGVLGTNSSVAGTNIISAAVAAASGAATGLASAAAGLGNGFNAAIIPRINGKYYLGALATFLQNTGDANILSTPNLLTLDNEEAKIVIGQNVPFVTGSTILTSGATTSPYTSVERKDVGLTLRVKPQINANGTVKMAIFQEVSSVDSATLNNTNGPTTTKRSIESNVLVDDGSIVVLGGLLADDYSLRQDKVPGLGDLPVLGALFRSERRTRNKSNLMVFLRPVVVRDATDTDSLTQDRYDAIRTLQQNIQPAPSAVMNSVDGAPILPVFPQRNRREEDGIRGTTLVPPPLAPNVTAPSGPLPRRGVLPPTSDPLTRQETQ